MTRALLLLALLGCGRTRIEERPPHVLVSPPSIEFGTTPILFPVQRMLQIESVGFAPLTVTLSLSGDAFAARLQPFTLQPEATLQLPITFTPPSSGDFAGELTLQTDDPNQPALAVPLHGIGGQSGAVKVEPLQLDFGRVGEGQSATRTLTIESLGPADLFLDSLAVAPGTPAAFGFVGSVRTPAALTAGSKLQLAMHFSPTPQTQLASGNALIETSDPAQPQIEVPLIARINRAPVPVIAGSTVVDAAIGSLVALDGTQSYDPDGDTPLTFRWSLDERPQLSSAVLSSAAAPTPQLMLDAAGIYSISLIVTDATGLQSLSPARVAIQALPPVALLIELTWDKIPPDLDLHFLQHGAAVDSAGDCYWANPDPAFGPHHDGDELVGYGPEEVEWAVPAPGQYDLNVVYTSAHGAASPATNAQLRVYNQGVLSSVLTHAFSKEGEAWSAGTLTWPGGNVVSP